MMKIIKLDRRFAANKNFNQTVAMKFDAWIPICSQIRKSCSNLLGDEWNNYRWTSGYGSNWDRKYKRRCYYITFRDPEDLTLILLANAQVLNPQ